MYISSANYCKFASAFQGKRMEINKSATHNRIMRSDCDTILDAMFSHRTSVPAAQSNAPHLNNQKQIAAEFPALSMLHGEPMNDVYTGFNISNLVGLLDCDALLPRNAPLGRNTFTDPSCPTNNAQVQEPYLGGMPISASSLATILAAQCGPHDNLNELATSSPCSAYPLDILKSSVSNDYDDALNSAFAASLNCEYDGILGAMNCKWDFDKFLADYTGKVPGRTGFQSLQLMGNINPDGWISSDNANVGSNNPSSSSKFSNELSLSLSMCQPIIHGTSIPDQCLEINCAGVTHRSLNGRQLGSETSCNSKNLSLSSGSCRPVQFPQFLSGSRYLPVIQKILAEISSYSLENLVKMNYSASQIGAGAKFMYSSGRHADTGSVVGSDDFRDRDARFEVQMDPVLQGRGVEAKRKQLLALLQVVDDQYNQCSDEIHTAISAFHAATELDPQIHARFTLQRITSSYKNLRERISTQILAMGSYCNKDTREEDRSFETSFIQKQWALQQLRIKDQQLWRPQRGLPERSVSVLRAWMFQNFLHPYPKDAEKHLLAVRSGLTRSQVSNWFINARVRLWKPMIEEMYTQMNWRKAGGMMKTQTAITEATKALKVRELT